MWPLLGRHVRTGRVQMYLKRSLFLNANIWQNSIVANCKYSAVFLLIGYMQGMRTWVNTFYSVCMRAFSATAVFTQFLFLCMYNK